MNFTKKCVAAAALCMMSAVSFAESKIAILNPQMAILSTTYAKGKFEKMEKTPDYVATKAKIDGISSELKALGETYKKESGTWSNEKKADAEKKIQSLQQDGQFNAKKLQATEQELAQQLLQELAPKYQAALKQIIDAEKIGLILNGQAAIHATAEYDITTKVSDAINKAK